MWKVAIFDDNQVVVDALCRSIDWKSINCSICGVASNGTDALAVINNAQPNIVITDILMPGFSGLELAAMAKKTHQSTKFMKLSILVDTFCSKISCPMQLAPMNHSIFYV